ncbi:hypothetical protein R69927_05926 [Paraburkholderia domus]|nr:hypothetical protein R69927_05926 [Paraburkholderia domus]
MNLEHYMTELVKRLTIANRLDRFPDLSQVSSSAPSRL